MSRNVPGRVGMLVFAFALSLAGISRADVKLPSIIGDNMVLQRDMRAPIWGWADPGEKVTVRLGGKEGRDVADAKGKWMVKLGPFPAGGPVEMIVSGKNTITVKNILVGEVWVCSGQSNMGMSLQGASTAQEAIAGANFPGLRLFQAALTPALEPQEDVKGEWKVSSPQTVPSFSAAGFFFGRELHKDLKLPVGMIESAWGGTVAEAWTSLSALESQPSLKHMADQFKSLLEKHPDLKEKFTEYSERWNKEFGAYRKAKAEWEQEAQKAKAEGKPAPPQPKGPESLGSKNTPTVLYNGMIVPLIPYGIRGAIWYQGEGNSGRAYEYRTLFPAMIKCWRKAWDEGDFPFLFVQLPNFREPVPEPTESTWAEIREAFLMTLSVPNTGMAVTIDIGEAGNIHPKNKEEVGRRLALCALGTVYGRKIVYSSPLYESAARDGNKIRVKFKNVGGGLVARGGEPLKQFAIAGEDKKFVWGEAKIVGKDSVVVWSDQVPRPVAVRYAWADNPEGCNLCNKEGLPASPFRTDDWPGITSGKSATE